MWSFDLAARPNAQHIPRLCPAAQSPCNALPARTHRPRGRGGLANRNLHSTEPTVVFFAKRRSPVWRLRRWHHPVDTAPPIARRPCRRGYRHLIRTASRRGPHHSAWTPHRFKLVPHRRCARTLATKDCEGSTQPCETKPQLTAGGGRILRAPKCVPNHTGDALVLSGQEL
jgi:hypothetical protein